MSKFWLVNPVEAVHFTVDNLREVIEFMGDVNDTDVRYSTRSEGITIETPGSMIFLPEDSWLVRVSRHQYHVIDDGRFRELYRKCDEKVAARSLDD